MKKRLICVLLSMVMLFSLAACERRSQRTAEGAKTEKNQTVKLQKPPKRQTLFLPPKSQRGDRSSTVDEPTPNLTAVETKTEPESDNKTTVEVVGNDISGLEPVDQNIVNQLSSDLNVGPWNRKQILQGIEWNTDKMDRYYVCNGKTIEAYDENGRFINSSKDVGKDKLASLDYYDGKIFSTMRSSNNGKFKLRIYDADSLELLLSTNLTDIHKRYEKDMKKYEASLIPSIDGIMIAPAIGGTDMRIYISYNVYYSIKDYLALNVKQIIYSYDYESSIRNSKEIIASDKYYVNLGPIKHGIQTLEYDRSTGNIWCAVRQGLSDYSLYCIDSNTFEIIPNDKHTGWDCAHAGDGFCSLGNDTFYVLVPEYGESYSSGVIVKAKLDELELVG